MNIHTATYVVAMTCMYIHSHQTMHASTSMNESIILFSHVAITMIFTNQLMMIEMKSLATSSYSNLCVLCGYVIL